jgi:cob(I)alamin adenosyltransferase
MTRKITAHPGDDGHSDLISGERPSKDDPVFECLGWLDELNAALGQLRVAVRAAKRPSSGVHADDPRPPVMLDADLRAVQLVLGRIMGVVASPSEPASTDEEPVAVTPSAIIALEKFKADLRARTAIKNQFYVPGDTTGSSALADVARARCRTAERALVRLGGQRRDHPLARRYLNRLSDYLFVVARFQDA